MAVKISITNNNRGEIEVLGFSVASGTTKVVVVEENKVKGIENFCLSNGLQFSKLMPVQMKNLI